MIGVIGHIEEFRQTIQSRTEAKKLNKEENPYDAPINKDRMQYSFLWDRI